MSCREGKKEVLMKLWLPPKLALAGLALLVLLVAGCGGKY